MPDCCEGVRHKKNLLRERNRQTALLTTSFQWEARRFPSGP